MQFEFGSSSRNSGNDDITSFDMKVVTEPRVGR